MVQFARKRDDTLPVVHSTEQLQCLVPDFERVYKTRRLRVNVQESKAMVMEGERIAPQLEGMIIQHMIFAFLNISAVLLQRKAILCFLLNT